MIISKTLLLTVSLIVALLLLGFLSCTYLNLLNSYNHLARSHDDLVEEVETWESRYNILTSDYENLKNKAVETFLRLDCVALITENISYWNVTNLQISITITTSNTTMGWKNDTTWWSQWTTSIFSTSKIYLQPEDNETVLFTLHIPVFMNENGAIVDIQYYYDGESIPIGTNSTEGNQLSIIGIDTIIYGGWKNETLVLSEDSMYYIGG